MKATYAEQNKGKLRRYQITRVNSKHVRYERVDNRLVPVIYGGPGQEGVRNVITLTPEDATTKLAHMGLLPLDREKVVIINDAAAEKAAAEKAAAEKAAAEKAAKKS